MRVVLALRNEHRFAVALGDASLVVRLLAAPQSTEQTDEERPRDPHPNPRSTHFLISPLREKGADYCNPAWVRIHKQRRRGSRQTAGPWGRSPSRRRGYRNRQEETTTNWFDNPNSHPEMTNLLNWREGTCVLPPALTAMPAGAEATRRPSRAIAPLKSTLRTPAALLVPEKRCPLRTITRRRKSR